MLTLDQAEHLVELTFPLEPRIVHANPMVREDIGKVSILKGPVVYCAEETDNGGNLPAYYISGGAKLMEEYREDILGGTAVIRVEAKKAAGSWDAIITVRA